MKGKELLSIDKEKCFKLYNNEKPLKIEWIIAILISTIMLFMFYYIDFKSLTIWSTNIWDTIADGDITQYYEYTSKNIYNVPHKYVSGPLFNIMIWSIWNLPIWIIQRFMGKVIIKNFILMLWSKLFLVVVLGITLLFAYKICKLLFKDKNKSLWLIYLSFTFLFTYLGVFYAGQTDILICMYATIGFYFLLREKNGWFYFFSAMAISIKYFFLIPYIPIILLLEKNIWKVFAKIMVGISPVVIFKLLVRNFPMYALSEKSNHSNQILDGFMNGIKGINGSTISLFLVAYIIICFVAYMINPKTKQEKFNYLFYFSVIPIMIMMMFSSYYEFYRPILIMPMLMILYGFKPELFRINVILDTIMSISYLITMSTVNIGGKYMFASKYSMGGTIIPKILGLKKIKTLNPQILFKSICGENIQTVMTVSASIMVSALAIMLIINYPRLKIKIKERENPQKLERWIIWLRTVLVVPMLVYLLICL